MYEYIAPILTQNKLPHCFVTTDCFTDNVVLPADRYSTLHQVLKGEGAKAETELYLNPQEMKKLIDVGFEIGSHTMSHPELGVIPLSEQENQIKLSKQKLEKTLAINVRYFSYPIGSISAETSQIVKEMAIRQASEQVRMHIYSRPFHLPQFQQ
jgi:peptidoglycan/xylan/chitin deacetylase (PgdA/CDA1 family)